MPLERGPAEENSAAGIPTEGAPTERSPVERLRRRDELLQILFWLEGEGFESDMSPPGVSRFLGWPEAEIAAGLAELTEIGFAAGPTPMGTYELTATGRQEGGRRFVEEFAGILSRPTHHGGECHDPDCGCHDDPVGAECVNRAPRP